MTDRFEERLSLDLRTFAEGGVRPIDRRAIAEAAIARGRRSDLRGAIAARLGLDARAPLDRRSGLLVRVTVIATLIVALLAAALWVAGIPAPPDLPRVYQDKLVVATDLLEARVGSSAVLLADGRVLIVGGSVVRGAIPDAATAEVYDPASGRSVPVGSSMWSVTSSAQLRDGRVMLVGAGSAQTFDPRTLQFAPAGGTAEPRVGGALVSLRDGGVLLIGGWDPADQGRTVRAIERFAPASGTFVTVGALPDGFLEQGLDSLTLEAFELADGRVAAVGRGRGANFYVVLIDPSTGNAEVDRPGGDGIIFEAAVKLPDDRVVALGGYGVVVWDNGAWTPVGPGPHVTNAIVLDDGRIVVTGLLERGDFGAFDPDAGFAYTSLGETGSEQPAVVLLQDGRLMLVGGSRDGAPTAVVQYLE